MNWFAHCRTLDEVKAEYRRLCFLHHPDRGGDKDLMQAINSAYRTTLQHGVHSAPAYTPPPPNWPRHDQYPPPPAPPADPFGPQYSREYVRQLWDNAPWRTISKGRFARTVGRYTVTLVHFSSQRQHLWAVQVGEHLNLFAYETRAEAEEDGFNLLFSRLQAGKL